MHNQPGCSSPVPYVLATLFLFYGIGDEIPDGSMADRVVRVLTYASPLTVLVACALLPRIWRNLVITQQQRRQRLQQAEAEERSRTEHLLDLRKERLRQEQRERQSALDQQHELELEQLRQIETAAQSAKEDVLRKENEERDWELKLARMECERQFEVFRHLMRNDFSESRFKGLLKSHLGADCPRDQILKNKNEILQLVALLVGESYGTTEKAIKYNDAPSAIEFFQREIDKVENMDMDQDDKEMLIALVRKRRVTVLDRMINDDTDNP